MGFGGLWQTEVKRRWGLIGENCTDEVYCLRNCCVSMIICFFEGGRI